MKRNLILPTAFALILASFCAAQTTTNPNPPSIADIVAQEVQRLTTLLTLTTAQQTQATTLFTTEETALAAIRTSQQTAQTALQTAVEANSTGGITAAATQLGTLATQQFEAQGTAQAAFYLVLTTAQQTIYKELLSGGYLGGGPGGPGPGGPGGHH